MIYLWDVQLLGVAAFVIFIAVVYVLASVMQDMDEQKERRKKRNVK